MSTSVELKRANKITTFWAGEGVAVGNFYRTHDKILSINSTDAAVISAGFSMPESVPATETTPGTEVTPQEKLEAFKNFLAMNASQFGIMYDPVDRRPDEFKFPNKYTEEDFAKYAETMVANVLGEVMASVNTNVIAKMVEAGHIGPDSQLAITLGEGIPMINEKYGSGSLKYATMTYPVTMVVGDKSMQANIEIDLVSGQLKKPRNIGNYVLTMTGLKNALIENGLLPKIEKPKVEEPTAEDEAAPTQEMGEQQ